MHRPHPERGMRVLALRIASSPPRRSTPHHASSGFRRRSRVVVVVFAGVPVAAPGRHGGRARQFHGDPFTGRRGHALDRE